MGVGASIFDTPVSIEADFLSRRLSTNNAIPPAMKYNAISGIASNIIVNGSAVGVNAAVKRTMEKTQARQGFKIVSPRKKPMRLKVTKKTGSSNASPIKE